MQVRHPRLPERRLLRAHLSIRSVMPVDDARSELRLLARLLLVRSTPASGGPDGNVQPNKMGRSASGFPAMSAAAVMLRDAVCVSAFGRTRRGRRGGVPHQASGFDGFFRRWERWENPRWQHRLQQPRRLRATSWRMSNACPAGTPGRAEVRSRGQCHGIC